MQSSGPRADPRAEELLLLVLRAANAAERLEPERLNALALADALADLRQALETLAAAFSGRHDDGLASMARWELDRILRTIDEIGAPAGDDEEAARAIGGLRQRAIGMLIGLDRAIAAQGGAPLLEGLAEREQRRALALREALLEFRATVRVLDEETMDADLRLRDAAAGLRRLAEGQGLRQLRLGDRRQVQDLLARIEGNREGGGPEGAVAWKDVVAFAELALEINRRPDLRDHDRELARALIPVLAARPAALDSIAFRKRLLRLRGRDGALDRLLETGGSAAEIRLRLEAIAAELEG